ncbi:Rad2 nuclease, partial [Mortierella sp. AD010]
MAMDKTTALIYFDGAPPVEKVQVHHKRKETRRESLDKANKHADVLMERINQRLRVRKRHFQSVQQNLRRAFHLDPAEAGSLLDYLRSTGWKAIESETEADIRIARDCLPGDVVVSRDSDLLIYQSVETVWRPTSGGRFLEYVIDDILDMLGLTRSQWIALGVVSKNDYNSNIYGLGWETNFNIIKALNGDDPSILVQQYLEDPRVVMENKKNVTFDAPARVFIHKLQTPISQTSMHHPPAIIRLEEPSITFQSVNEKLRTAKKNLAALKAVQQEPKIGKKSANTEARHKPTQKFNRYRTIDQPPSESNTVFRPRYSFKTRQRTKTHDPPKALKQYEYKVPKDPVKSPEDVKSTPTASSKHSGIKQPLPTNTLKRKDLLKALTWEHPTSALDVGTLHKNVEYALGESHAAKKEIIKVIRRAVRVASKEKKRCQRLIAKYIQLIVSPENFHDDDRVILAHLCPYSSPCNSGSSIENNEEDEQDADDTDIDDSSGKQEQFIRSLMISLYSQNKPLGKIANVVNTFISRLEDLKLLPQRQQSRVGALKKKTEFPSGALLRSVSVQMCAELKKHYKVDCEKLLEKLTKQQEKGLLPAESRVEVRSDVSAIENFAYLNKLAYNAWRLAPLSPVKDGFVSFSELELIAILWQSPILKPLIQNLYTLTSGVPSLEVTQRGLEPGRVINALLCKVGIDGLSWSQRKKAGIRAAIEMPASSEVVAHVNILREPAFDPRTYNTKGYFMRPSIRTNGFRLFLLAFKKKELQSVRFRRYPEDVLPNRLLSTIGGTDSFLTEIRNVIQLPDIQEYLGDKPDRVKILGLDLGQACT